MIGLAVEQMDAGRLPRAFVGVAAQYADQVAGKLMRTDAGFGVSRHGLGLPDNFSPRPATFAGF